MSVGGWRGGGFGGRAPAREIARNGARIISQAMLVVVRHVMRDAGLGGVHARAAERFLIDHLAGCAFHEIGSAQAHEAGLLDHDDAIAERGQVSAAGDARPHHGGDLRDAHFAAHERVVKEDAPCAVLPGEDSVLIRQVHARGIDQVDDGHAIAHGDFLRAQNLGDGLRPPGTGLHRGIIGDDYGGAAFDESEAGDDASGWRLAVIKIVAR